MVVYREWIVRSLGGLNKKRWSGWFLLGFIPIYLRIVTLE